MVSESANQVSHESRLPKAMSRLLEPVSPSAAAEALIIGEDLACVHDFEIASLDMTQQVKLLVIPPRIWCPLDEPGRSVVRQEHAVLLKRADNHLDVLRRLGLVKIRSKPEP